MPKFVLTYISNEQQSASPEEGQKHREEWMAWLQGLGDAALEPQNPFKTTQTVLSDGTLNEGSRRTGLMGYSLIKADHMEDAVRISQDCPFILRKMGEIEVSEIMEMG